MRKLIVTTLLMALAATSLQAASPLETLRNRLVKFQKKGIMIGHQDDPLYGMKWHFDQGRSDVKEVCGDYPAVMGFDLGNLELDSLNNLDGVPFDRMRMEIVAHHLRGGIVTISWHANNPVTGKNAWDPSGNPVRELLPRGSQNDKFLKWMNRVAVFLNSLKTRRGETVPVIFRPWHEMHGGWFWWGKDSCTPQEYKELFEYTIQCLRNQGVRSCLYCYSPGATDGQTETNYLKYYPGDEFVDVIGVDIYAGADKDKYIRNMRDELAVMTKYGKEHNKIVCVAETGYRNTPDPFWFTTAMWNAVKDFKISYVLLWRNAWDQPEENFGPAPDKTCAEDFVNLYNLKETLFLQDISKKKFQQFRMHLKSQTP